MAIEYREPIDAVRALMRDTFNGRLLSFYEGDPELIPIANLPAFTIEKVRDITASAATGTDRVVEQLLLKFILDRSDDLGANDDDDLTTRKIRLLIEERDPVTGMWLPGTVKYVLRKSLTLRQLGLDQQMSVEILPEVIRSDSLFTAEGHLTISFSYRVPVPQRT